ncbi:Uma2 family endonuclease [Spirulina major CS-329]|uniref:Uma2 family endonuclease n=1 Tax=Spirulina TaxID=1154 RepID=UPI00232B9D75|nr:MULTISPECIES: Uma2 family endonuclease [Spirulina]MDB9497031.1 Uma2 family endonuclease [Spirulina subsalsa CS-330]MDB9505379.1 Uma2 family endonuclease [Spirulina major CS-329]
MIAAKENFPTLTPEEYFAWEEQQLEKHELINGRVYGVGQCYARQDNRVNHSQIAVRLTTILDHHLDPSCYIIGNSDLHVNVVGTQDYVHPDASVTCNERDHSTTQYIRYPCLIVEVLSPSTEAYDRGEKFRHYRQNPALIDYLLVSSTGVAIDLYHKNNAGDWLIFNYQPGDAIALKSINLSVPIEQIYRGLNLTES